MQIGVLDVETCWRPSLLFRPLKSCRLPVHGWLCCFLFSFIQSHKSLLRQETFITNQEIIIIVQFLLPNTSKNMKLCTRSILGIFMLMSSCYHFVDSRPGFHRSLVRRDTISDTCTEQQKILFRPALKEAQTIVWILPSLTKPLTLTIYRQKTCMRGQKTS